MEVRESEFEKIWAAYIKREPNPIKKSDAKIFWNEGWYIDDDKKINKVKKEKSYHWWW